MSSLLRKLVGMNSDLVELARLLREALGDRPQSWLAKEARTTDATISRLLNGKTVPTPETLERVARALNLDFVHLMRLAGVALPVGDLDPYAAYMARRVTDMPPDQREHAIDALSAVLDNMISLAELARLEAEARRVAPDLYSESERQVDEELGSSEEEPDEPEE